MAEKAKSAKSVRFIRMYGPLLDALREVGGESRARDVKQIVADRVVLEQDERTATHKTGVNRVENEVAWARNTLADAGLIERGVHGVWRLTEDGWRTKMTLAEARDLRRRVQKTGKEADYLETSASEDEPAPEVEPEDSYSLLDTIKSLSPQGFERLCQHILRRSGFVDVEVTGKSGDGGIDGNGILRVNALVSFQVLFQCKRYQGSVAVGTIRDFRGAMSGRTDKGIILTTGRFTREAEVEAIRPGVPPIELVDGERLVQLMKDLKIGVKERIEYDVDRSFFDRLNSA